MNQRLKYIVTVGPASESERVLKQLIESGADIIRINGSHCKPSYILQIKNLVERLNKALGTDVEVMLDLPGPKIRTGGDPDYKLEIKTGKSYTIGGKGDIPLEDALADGIKLGSIIKLSDGKLELKAVSRKSMLTATALNQGVLNPKQSIYAPGLKYTGTYPTTRDKQLISAGDKAGIRLFGLSFVSSAADVENCRKLIKNGALISKIETQEAINNIEQIIRASDLIMVARGDLGLWIGIEKVPEAQRLLIAKAQAAKKQVIVATQMLYSMVNNPMPTRAEANDVFTSVEQGADALMLSEESAIGIYPVKALKTLKAIAERALSYNQSKLTMLSSYHKPQQSHEP